MNEASFYDGDYKTNKVNMFNKKQVNEFVRVKCVIILNFQDEKVIFYAKDVNKTVP